MNIYKTTFYGIVVFILCSCSFNGTFHRPTQIAAFEELTHYYSGEDTLYIEYTKAKQEIILKDVNLNTINENYTIRNKYFVSSNGNRLNGWLLTPKSIEPIATILHFHGSAGNLLTHYQFISPLIDYGYQVFMFDYSGYGCSEGEPAHDIIMQDGYSALEYIKKQDDFRANKTILYGQSYGGYLASIIGSNSQESVDGIVIEGAFSSLKKEARHKASVFGNFVKSGIHADKEIKKNYKPFLIIHSKEDQMVPIKLGQEIYINANYPKEFYEIDGTHISGLQRYSREIANKIQRMIIKE